MSARCIVSCLLAAAMAAGGAVAARSQDFDWTWDRKGEATAAPAPVAVAPAAAPAAEAPAAAPGFDWTWDRQDKASVTPAPVVAAPVAPAAPPVTDPQAAESYSELLRENLELRRKIDDALRDEAAARRDKERMERDMRDMEERIALFVRTIQELKQQQADGTAASAAELATRLENAEQERDRLLQALAEARKLRDMPAAMPPGGSVQEGSDLFREKERENTLLRKKLQEIESDRRRGEKEREQQAREAAQAREKAQQAETSLKQVKSELNEAQGRVAQHREAMQRLLEEKPVLEQKVETLTGEVSRRDVVLMAREREIEAARMELERREYRLRKAERMNELLETARVEVSRVDHREKRDMHYNMAVVYAKEGRARDAEMEYLKALRLDPGDADVHYNLGILYEDALQDPRKASVHYRRYLMLKPAAPDADQVRTWLLQIDSTP